MGALAARIAFFLSGQVKLAEAELAVLFQAGGVQGVYALQGGRLKVQCLALGAFNLSVYVEHALIGCTGYECHGGTQYCKKSFHVYAWSLVDVLQS